LSVKPFFAVNSCGLFAISPSYEDSFDVWPAGPRFKGAIGLETDHDAIPGEKHRGEMLGKTWEKPWENPLFRFFGIHYIRFTAGSCKVCFRKIE